MNSTLEIYSLVAVTIMLLIIIARGTFEYFLNMPKWFAAPPASFKVIREQAKGSAKFWIPVQILFLISYFAALISNWNTHAVKTYIIYAGLSYLIVIISTASYFVNEIMDFQKMPDNTLWTEKLQKRVDIWYNTTVIRNILQVVALVLIIVAMYTRFSS